MCGCLFFTYTCITENFTTRMNSHFHIFTPSIFTKPYESYMYFGMFMNSHLDTINFCLLKYYFKYVLEACRVCINFRSVDKRFSRLSNIIKFHMHTLNFWKSNSLILLILGLSDQLRSYLTSIVILLKYVWFTCTINDLRAYSYALFICTHLIELIFNYLNS